MTGLRLAVAFSAILAFNFVQTLSREAGTLELEERVAALGSERKPETEFLGQLCTALPIAPTLTAAMTVFPDQEAYTLGGTYGATAAGTVLPKVLVGPGRFTSANARFHELYYPEVESFSMDYSLAAEGYQNFSFLGILVAYFAMGSLLANGHKLASLHPRSLWVPLCLACFIPGMWSLRSDSNTFFKVSVYTSVVLAGLYLAARLLPTGRRARP